MQGKAASAIMSIPNPQRCQWATFILRKLTSANVEILTASVALGTTDCGGFSTALLSFSGNESSRINEWWKAPMAGFSAAAMVLSPGPSAHFRSFCCVFDTHHRAINVRGTPRGPQHVYLANHIAHSPSSSFDLTLLLPLPKSVLLSPVPSLHVCFSKWCYDSQWAIWFIQSPTPSPQ